MAPVTLPEDLQAKLSLLVTQDTPIVKEFCRLASQYFKQEVKAKVFTSAATKLAVQPTQVEDAVQALVFLLVRCGQLNTTTTELHTLSTSLGFNEDATQVLINTYTNTETDVKEYLNTLAVQTPQYKNLEWRFDILVGSRSLHHIAEPLLTLQLSLDTGSESTPGKGDEETCENLLLQTDPNNLLHLTSALEDALHEARTHHSRRVQRYLK